MNRAQSIEFDDLTPVQHNFFKQKVKIISVEKKSLLLNTKMSFFNFLSKKSKIFSERKNDVQKRDH